MKEFFEIIIKIAIFLIILFFIMGLISRLLFSGGWIGIIIVGIILMIYFSKR